MAKHYKELIVRTRLGHISQIAGQAYFYAEAGKWEAAEHEVKEILEKIHLLQSDLADLVKRGEQAMGEEAGVVEEAVQES